MLSSSSKIIFLESNTGYYLYILFTTIFALENFFFFLRCNRDGLRPLFTEVKLSALGSFPLALLI